MKSSTNKILWLSLFSIAMGFLEAAVVVYLRAIYYPRGFDFPLSIMDSKLVLVELLREAATVIMLLGIGILSGTNTNQRLANFIAAFAIWDIFYYVFLKLVLDWPASFFAWDILFLIPVPWVGPVLAPCLVSLTMLLMAYVLHQRDGVNSSNRINLLEWVLILSGCAIIVGTWMADYFSLTWGKTLSAEEALQVFSNYVPQTYLWGIFALGEAIILAGIFRFWRRTKNV
jgi:hypothetical protein